MVTITDERFDMLIELVSNDTLNCPEPYSAKSGSALCECPEDVTCSECWRAYALSETPQPNR